MPIEIFFLYYLGFLMLCVVYQLFLRPPTTKELLDEAIEDIKNGEKCHPCTPQSWSQSRKLHEAWQKAHPVKHFLSEVGWWIKHIWTELMELPLNIKCTVTCLYQRCSRGYSYQDVWELNSHVARVVIGGIKHLKKTACYGNGLLLQTSDTYNPKKDIGSDNDPDQDFDVKESKRIIKEILWAWDITLRCTDGRRYFYRAGFNQRKDKKHLTIAEENRRIKGLNLWIKHYHSLCD